MCICLKVSCHDLVSASACITVVYVDYKDRYSHNDRLQATTGTTFSDQRGRKTAPAAKLEHPFYNTVLHSNNAGFLYSKVLQSLEWVKNNCQ